MKIFVLFFMTFFFSLTITAQVGAGEKMIGINTSVLLNQSFYFNEIPYGKSTSFSISPVFGFGIKNNWMVGTGIGYSYSRSNYTNQALAKNSKTSLITSYLFARKFYPLNEVFGIFGQADLSFSWGKTDSTGSGWTDDVANIDSYEMLIKPGFYFKANKKLFFDATIGRIGYIKTNYKYDNGKTDTDEFVFSLINSFSVGIKYIF